jgi:hypothetical protein
MLEFAELAVIKTQLSRGFRWYAWASADYGPTARQVPMTSISVPDHPASLIYLAADEHEEIQHSR